MLTGLQLCRQAVESRHWLPMSTLYGLTRRGSRGGGTRRHLVRNGNFFKQYLSLIKPKSLPPDAFPGHQISQKLLCRPPLGDFTDPLAGLMGLLLGSNFERDFDRWELCSKPFMRFCAIHCHHELRQPEVQNTKTLVLSRPTGFLLLEVSRKSSLTIHQCLSKTNSIKF